MPFIDVYAMGLYDSKRLYQIILLIILSLTTYFTINFEIEKKTKYIFLTLLLLATLSAINSDNTLKSSLGLFHLLLLPSLIIAGILLHKESKIRSFFLLLFFINIFANSFFLMNYIFFIYSDSIPNAGNIIHSFINIRFLNQFQVLTIPILCYFLSNKEYSRLAYIFLITNLFIVIFTGARGALAALTITLILFFHFKLIDKRFIKKLLTPILFSFILFIFHVFFLDQMQQLHFVTRTSSSGRIDIWLNLINHLNLSNIIIGYGPSSFYHKESLRSHPHNSLLQLLYNYGFTFLILVLFLLKNIKIKVIKKCTLKPSQPSFYLTILSSVIAAGIYSLFSGIFVMPIPQTLSLIFMGALISILYPDIVKGGSINKSKIFVITLLLVGYISNVIISYHCMNSAYYGPGFWSNGQFSFSECRIPFKEK